VPVIPSEWELHVRRDFQSAVLELRATLLAMGPSRVRGVTHRQREKKKISCYVGVLAAAALVVVVMVVAAFVVVVVVVVVVGGGGGCCCCCCCCCCWWWWCCCCRWWWWWWWWLLLHLSVVLTSQWCQPHGSSPGAPATRRPRHASTSTSAAAPPPPTQQVPSSLLEHRPSAPFASTDFDPICSDSDDAADGAAGFAQGSGDGGGAGDGAGGSGADASTAGRVKDVGSVTPFLSHPRSPVEALEVRVAMVSLLLCTYTVLAPNNLSPRRLASPALSFVCGPCRVCDPCSVLVLGAGSVPCLAAPAWMIGWMHQTLEAGMKFVRHLEGGQVLQYWIIG